MKKLFILLTITLLSITAIGQEIGMGGVADFFRDIPAYKMFECKRLNLEETYSFVVNGKQYLVSYEERPDNLNSSAWKNGEKRIRNLYLYRLDSDGWKIATDAPLKIDYKQYVDGVHVANYYYPCLNKGGSVEFQDGGVIAIYLTYMFNTPVTQRTRFDTKSIILAPTGNNMYHVSATGSTLY
jgi:hypothetical protein